MLHVAPEAYVGGNLALVRSGDLITLDVPTRRQHCFLQSQFGATAGEPDIF